MIFDLSMPRGKPKKGFRRPGGGRKKGRKPVTLVVTGARSQTLVRKTRNTKGLTPQEMYRLQDTINGFTPEQVDRLFNHLGYADAVTDEIKFDIESLTPNMQRAFADYVDELYRSSIQNVQKKIDKLSAVQVEQVITFLNVCDCNDNNIVFEWDALSPQKKQQLDKLLDTMINVDGE